MGMYNEVHAPCPDCKDLCTIQVPQVILGFGDFHVDRPETLSDLSFDDKLQLKEYIEGRAFYCDTHGPFEVKIEVREKLSKFMF